MNNEEKKTSQDLSNEELGKLTRAKMEGKTIETLDYGRWTFWDDDFHSRHVYRVKPIPEFKTRCVHTGIEVTNYIEIAALERALKFARANLDGMPSMGYGEIDAELKRLEGWCNG